MRRATARSNSLGNEPKRCASRENNFPAPIRHFPEITGPQRSDPVKHYTVLFITKKRTGDLTLSIGPAFLKKMSSGYLDILSGHPTKVVREKIHNHFPDVFGRSQSSKYGLLGQGLDKLRMFIKNTIPKVRMGRPRRNRVHPDASS